MKLNKLIKSFENFFSWDKNKIDKNRDEIRLLIEKLYKKRKILDTKLNNKDNIFNKKNIEKKIIALNKLIKKAENNLF
jgi:hypothetical protein